MPERDATPDRREDVAAGAEPADRDAPTFDAAAPAPRDADDPQATIAAAEPLPKPGSPAEADATLLAAEPLPTPAACAEPDATIAAAEPLPGARGSDDTADTILAADRPPPAQDISADDTLYADRAASAGRRPPAEESLDEGRATHRYDPRKAVRPAPDAAPASDRLPIIDRGSYAIGPVFAKGGIGRILQARDRALGRPVALKELLVRSRHAEERFVREALVTARLQHPGVVPIYAAGRWPSGEPFYAMKLVSGRPLADAIDEATTYDARLALLPHVLAVAETMAYAHSKRIIHRDLKPENVLLGAYGETVVIDWGLAKELGSDDLAQIDSAKHSRVLSRMRSPSSGRPLPGKDLTMVGSVMGTPAYMPPEQAYGDPVDERADVYSLGAILYHVLAGEPPFDGPTAMAILVEVTSGAPTPIDERQPATPPELAAIVATAMAYDPDERYPSAREFADDLRRFQTGQLVAAHRYSTGERVRRLVRRYRGPLAVAAVSLVILAIVSAVSVRRILAERDEARIAERRAADSAAQAAEAREESERAREVAERQADALALEQARVAASEEPGRAIELLAALHDKEDWPRLRIIAADAVAHGLGLNLVGHLAGVSRLAFSRDGRLLVSTGDDCALTVWDLERGEGRRLLGHSDEVWRVAFDPDDRRLASTSRDGTIALWNPRSGERLALFKAHAASARMIAFTRDGRLISGGDDNRLLLWDLDHERAELVDECLSGTFFTDGARVGCVSTDRAELRVFDLDSGARRVLRAGAGELLEPPGAFAPEGTDELVIGTRGGAVLRWRWPKSQVMRLRARGGENQIRVTRYTPDGRFIAAAGADRKVWVWERESGAQRWEFLGHTGRVTRLDVAPDARRLASIGGENGARLWDLDSGDGLLLTGLQRVATTVRFAPDGRSLAAASTGGEVRIWRGASLSDNPGARIPLPQALAVDPLRPRLATSDAAGDLTFWDLDSGAPQATLATGRPLAHLTFVADGGAMIGLDATRGFVELSPEGAVTRSRAGVGARVYSQLEASQDGRHVITTSTEDGALLHWDRESDSVAELVGHRDNVRDRAFSPDSRWLASGGTDRELRLWDLDARTSEVIDRHSLPITAVAFSTDGRYVLSGGDSHEIRVFDRIQGTVTADPLSGFYVRALVPFADGERVAVLNGDSAILIWDLRQRRVVHRLFGHQAPVRNVTLADDGATLLSQAEDNEIRLWDVASGESRVLGVLDDWLAALVWHPSRRIVAYTIRHQVGIWSDDVPRDRTSFLAWLADTRDNLTRRAADLEPVQGCPHGHPSDA